jgi:hypothetical protein
MRLLKRLWQWVDHVGNAAWLWGLGGAFLIATAGAGVTWVIGLPTPLVATGGTGCGLLGLASILGLMQRFRPFAWAAAAVDTGQQQAESGESARERSDLPRTLGHLEIVQAERDMARKELEEMKAAHPPAPIPPPPEKELLILFRSRGLPMFGAMHTLVDEAVRWLRSQEEGLAPVVARLLQEHVLEQMSLDKARAIESAAGGSTVAFDDAFTRFCWSYDTLVLWFGRTFYREPRVLTDKTSFLEWAGLHDKFLERLEELSLVEDSLKSAQQALIPAMKTAKGQLLQLFKAKSEQS